MVLRHERLATKLFTDLGSELGSELGTELGSCRRQLQWRQWKRQCRRQSGGLGFHTSQRVVCNRSSGGRAVLILRLDDRLLVVLQHLC